MLRRAVGLEGGKPFQGNSEKDSPVMPAPYLPQLLGSLQTVQQPAQTLPASSRPPTHCCQPHCIPQCNRNRPSRHHVSGGEPRQGGVMELPRGGEAAGKEEGRWGGFPRHGNRYGEIQPQLCEQLQHVLMDILQRLLANGKHGTCLKQKTLKSIK